jgi:Tfp pilus assembly protein PilF
MTCRRAIAALAALVLGWPTVVWAMPYTPTDDRAVLEHLRDRPTDPEAKKLRQLRNQLSRTPTDAALAAEFARAQIARARRLDDPRHLGYAQAALAPWWNTPHPPTEVLVLRATLKQANHEFAAALADLDLALKADPHDPQAWVTRATVLQVMGDYARARRSCVPLWRLTSPLATGACLAGVASLNGQADASLRLLTQLTSDRRPQDPAERLWALTLMAEIAQRLDRVPLAERTFARALALGADPYLLGTYADFLLEQNRPAEVVHLLKAHTRSDGLLLRLAIAERRLGDPAFAEHRAALAARFAAAERRGDSLHRREEARFALAVTDEPRRALTLALANWQVQREPADARVLLASALAAGERGAVREAITWLRASRLEDVRVQALIARLGG